MGQTPADVEREIRGLREETGWIVDELQYRARRAADVQAQVREHPYVAGGIGAGILAVIGALVYAVIRRRQEAARAAELQRRLRMAPVRRRAEALRRRLAERVSGMSERVTGAEERRPELFKRVLWSMFTAGMLAIAGLLVRRLSASVWKSTLHERPPERVP